MNIWFSKLIGPVLILASTGVVIVSIFAGDEAGSAPIEEITAVSQANPQASPSPIATPSPQSHVSAARESASCLVDSAAIDDIKKRREELDSKEKLLITKESELKAKENAIDEQFKKLGQLRDEITKMDGLHKKESEEKVSKLIETIETMSPKSASQLLTVMDDALAVTAIAKMSTPKLAKIMNIMEPTRSSQLTEMLTGVSREKAVALASMRGTTSMSTKGGGKDNGLSEQYSTAKSEPTSERKPAEQKK